MRIELKQTKVKSRDNMKRNEIKILVLTGDGINCEVETAVAIRELGAIADVVHISDLIENKTMLRNYQGLILPGGFSFGDEIGSGQVLALKLKYKLADELNRFVEDKKLILGICNGFQALVKLGILGNLHLSNQNTERVLTLTHNRQGHFINRWVDIAPAPSHCVWTRLVEKSELYLPIRHGEGRIVFAGDTKQQMKYYEIFKKKNLIPLSYCEDVNGSYQNVAGLTDDTGRIFGLMPHPEAAVSFWQNPSGGEKSGHAGMGLMIFESGLDYIENHF